MGIAGNHCCLINILINMNHIISIDTKYFVMSLFITPFVKMKKKLKSLLLLILLVVAIFTLQYLVIQLAYKMNSINNSRNRNDLEVTRIEKVMFLKTHKTASSTITSILNRFADINGLDIALPWGLWAKLRFDWPEPFQVESVDVTRLKKGRANVFCNHAVFSSKNELQKVLYPDTKYLTILRNPVERFESLFFYDNFHTIFKSNRTNPILEGLDLARAEEFKKKMSSEQKLIYSRLFFNGMIFDLSGKQIKPGEIGKVKDIIKQVEDNFDFVMIAEHFDEGLVLLRKLFRWKFIDLAYEKKNVRKSRHLELLTPEVRKKILELNKADFMLYKHFRDVFQKRMIAYGEKFERHLEIFRELNAIVNDKCKKSNYSEGIMGNLKDRIDEIDVTRKEMDLVGNLDELSGCFCVKLHRGEESYVRYFQEKYISYYYLHDDYDYVERC